ncbi:uroporphyrinogen-III C-methyltransferase [Chitinimonas lacunae]|uniref:uroporphyrinogen-III C-methyltransferase n=1 Tax=Chitinimonas lacunae TaxID=1963018 RepID=A0ABV8MVI1_9NEIS
MGKVYLVGAGPGAADLITVRGMRLLARADVVLYDALVEPEMLEYCPQAQLIAVGKRCAGAATAQRFINKTLLDCAARFGTVVRLKGGDPSLFGRAQEEIDALAAHGIKAEIVPGVTAALAAAAELGVSLTERGVARNVVFATARVGEGETGSDWVSAVAAADTAVLYMGVRQAAEIAAALTAAGLAASTPVRLVESASRPDCREFSFTLATLPDAAQLALSGPAILLLGDVFRARAALTTPLRAAA